MSESDTEEQADGEMPPLIHQVFRMVGEAFAAAADGTPIGYVSLVFLRNSGNSLHAMHTTNIPVQELRQTLLQLLLVLGDMERNGADGITNKSTIN